MKRNSKADDTNILQHKKFRNYNEVSSLSAAKLKDICSKLNIDNSLPRKAKTVYLCHALGISTTGANSSCNSSRKRRKFENLTSKQREELEKLTPKVLYKLPPSEWSSELIKIPEIEDTAVKQYLLDTNVLDRASSRTYKLSRPYQLKQFVHSVKYYENKTSETFSIISARCNPSQATSPDEVKVLHIILDKITGEPYCGYCTCTVGFSETCGHIGATLFRIAELVANGEKVLQSLPTCTEKLCGWSEPKGSKSEPDTFDNLQIRKKQTTVKRTAESYGVKVCAQEPPSYDAVAELHANLINATHHLGQYCPAVHVLNPSRFRKNVSNEETIKPTVLKDEMDSEMLAYSYEEIVETTPLPVTRIGHKTFKSDKEPGFEFERLAFIRKAAAHSSKPCDIDRLTKGQSNNSEWFEQRKGSITATKFAKVIKTIETDRIVKGLVGEILGNNNKDYLAKVPSIKWGRKHEDKARRLYTEKFSKLHTNLKVVQHGLLVAKECSYIRGSPDGIVSCDCHADNKRLLEIKCPYSARFMSIDQAVEKKKIKYLEKSSAGKYFLKSNSPDGYHEQMQGLMGISETVLGNLVVWTTVDMVIVTVKFDPEFYQNRLLSACKKFFYKHVIPAILIVPDHNTLELLSDSEEELTAVLAQCGTDISVCDPSSVPGPSQPICKSPTGNQAAALIVDSCGSEVSPVLHRNDHLPCRCGQCNKVLPDDNILDDNSNASVGCDCPNCGGCNVWFCWPCAKYTEEWVDENVDWFCPACTRECDLVY